MAPAKLCGIKYPNLRGSWREPLHFLQQLPGIKYPNLRGNWRPDLSVSWRGGWRIGV